MAATAALDAADELQLKAALADISAVIAPRSAASAATVAAD